MMTRLDNRKSPPSTHSGWFLARDPWTWVVLAFLSYVFVSIVSLFESHLRLRALGINLLDYAGISYFLSSGARNPQFFWAALLWPLLPLSAFKTLYPFKSWLHGHDSPRSLILRALILTTSFAIPLVLPFVLVSTMTNQSRESSFKVPDDAWYARVPADTDAGTASASYPIVARTDKYVFLIDGYQRLIATPISSIQTTGGGHVCDRADSLDSYREDAEVFVSYSHKNTEVVEQLITALKCIGVNVWFDRDRLIPGESMKEQIIRGIEESSVGLIFISSSYFGGRSTEYELCYMINNGSKIVPIRIDISHNELSEKYSIFEDIFTMDLDEFVNRLGLHRTASRLREYINAPLRPLLYGPEDDGMRESCQSILDL